MADLGRSAARERYQTCWHEAGHAVAGHLLGLQVEAVEIMGDELLNPSGEDPLCGFVRFTDHEISTLSEVVDAMVISLSGESAVRTAWALEALDEVALELDEVPIVELTLDVVQVSPNGATPTQRASYGSYQSSAAAVDVRHAEEMAAEWTESGLAAAALVGFAHAYTADLVASEKFQHHLGRFAAALIEVGSMNGDLAEDLLARYDVIYKPTAGGNRGTEIA